MRGVPRCLELQGRWGSHWSSAQGLKVLKGWLGFGLLAGLVWEVCIPPVERSLVGAEASDCVGVVRVVELPDMAD